MPRKSILFLISRTNLGMFSLTALHRQQIIEHATRTYPEECCGILLGTIDRQTYRKTLIEILETQNAWSEAAIAALSDLPALARSQDATSRRDRYWIDPQDLLKTQKLGRDRGLQVIGIYHSHPDHPAIPSECDRLLAWAEYVYVIVSVSHDGAIEFQGWILNEQHQFISEPIAIDSGDAAD
jgi:proteasome lid subunit RPN8/RPN11